MPTFSMEEDWKMLKKSLLLAITTQRKADLTGAYRVSTEV